MDIVGFTSMSKEVAPAAVMCFLNDLFGRFDAMLEQHGVSKVGYMGGSNGTGSERWVGKAGTAGTAGAAWGQQGRCW